MSSLGKWLFCFRTLYTRCGVKINKTNVLLSMFKKMHVIIELLVNTHTEIIFTLNINNWGVENDFQCFKGVKFNNSGGDRSTKS